MTGAFTDAGCIEHWSLVCPFVEFSSSLRNRLWKACIGEEGRLLNTVLTSFLERHLKILLNTQVRLPNMLLKHKGLATTTACACIRTCVCACHCMHMYVSWIVSIWHVYVHVIACTCMCHGLSVYDQDQCIIVLRIKLPGSMYCV